MIELFHSTGIDMLKEQLLHHEQKKRLSSMKKYSLERDRKNHNDFLCKFQSVDDQDDHLHRVEHHGLHFWTRCFSGEKPSGVIHNDRMPEHEYGTYEERDPMQTLLLIPSTDSIKIAPGSPKHPTTDSEAMQRWINLMRLGQAALRYREYAEAERMFRSALSEVGKRATGKQLYETLTALAQALLAQNKPAESAKLLESAKRIQYSDCPEQGE